MSITLSKQDGDNPINGLAKIAVGASWDTTAGMSGGLLGKIKRKVGTDLDAIAVLTSNGEPVRYAGIDVLDPVQNGAVVHSGDNQTGHGEGDDETITVDFSKLPSHVDGVLFVCAAFKVGSSLERAANVSFKVYTQGQGESRLEQVADIWPSLMITGNAVAVAKVHRVNDDWFLTVVNSPGSITQGDRRSLLQFAMGM
ncbi:MAG TPA: TerD family protein [Candidatus Paceibacterota bacterium]